MTKKTRKIIEAWLKWSIQEQSKLFNQNFITKLFYWKAVKKWLNAKY
jgi:hypothetical protein